MDLMAVVTQGMRTKMLENAYLASLVESSGGQYRIFFEAAEGQTDTPYIKMSHVWGGDMNNAPSQEFDMTYTVSVVAKTAVTVGTLLGPIREQLHRQKLPYPDGWTDWAGATITGHYKDILVIQGVNFWELGFYVRLRGSKPALSIEV